jgi:outer membrane protein assembly factor BamD
LIKRTDALERQQMERMHKMNEQQLRADELARERMTTDFTNKAAEAYGKIITRYPAMYRADAARERLAALHQPVPRPTKSALALNKAEEAGRGEQTTLSRLMSGFEKHPDVSPATRIGAPTLTDPTPVPASDIVKAAGRVAAGTPGKGNNSLSVQAIKGTPTESDPVPRSDAPVADPAAPANDPAATPAQPDPNELKPAADAGTTTPPANDPNELKPDAPADQPAPAPAQVNEIQPGNGTSPAATAAPNNDGQQLADDKDLASSKHKKKKGLLHKVIPGS